MWRDHRHKLKELPFRVALKHLLRGEAIEDTFWKFPEPCLSNSNVHKFDFSYFMELLLSVMYVHNQLKISELHCSWNIVSWLFQADRRPTLIRLAKQWTSMSSGTTPLFSWSLTCSSWSFSGLIRKIPSACKWNFSNSMWANQVHVTSHHMTNIQKA